MVLLFDGVLLNYPLHREVFEVYVFSSWFCFMLYLTTDLWSVDLWRYANIPRLISAITIDVFKTRQVDVAFPVARRFGTQKAVDFILNLDYQYEYPNNVSKNPPES